MMQPAPKLSTKLSFLRPSLQLQYVLDEEKQTVTSADGSVRFAVFDKCAVRIAVEEGAAHRRSLVLSLVPRSELPAEDLVG